MRANIFGNSKGANTYFCAQSEMVIRTIYVCAQSKIVIKTIYVCAQSEMVIKLIDYIKFLIFF
jgi:hypothetical protein